MNYIRRRLAKKTAHDFTFRIKIHSVDKLDSNSGGRLGKANGGDVELLCKMKRGRHHFETQMAPLKNGTAVWDEEIVFKSRLYYDNRNNNFEAKPFVISIQTLMKGFDFSTSVDVARSAVLNEVVSVERNVRLYPSGVLKLTITSEEIREAGDNDDAVSVISHARSEPAVEGTIRSKSADPPTAPRRPLLRDRNQEPGTPGEDDEKLPTLTQSSSLPDLYANQTVDSRLSEAAIDAVLAPPFSRPDDVSAAGVRARRPSNSFVSQHDADRADKQYQQQQQQQQQQSGVPPSPVSILRRNKTSDLSDAHNSSSSSAPARSQTVTGMYSSDEPPRYEQAVRLHPLTGAPMRTGESSGAGPGEGMAGLSPPLRGSSGDSTQGEIPGEFQKDHVLQVMRENVTRRSRAAQYQQDEERKKQKFPRRHVEEERAPGEADDSEPPAVIHGDLGDSEGQLSRSAPQPVEDLARAAAAAKLQLQQERARDQKQRSRSQPRTPASESPEPSEHGDTPGVLKWSRGIYLPSDGKKRQSLPQTAGKQTITRGKTAAKPKSRGSTTSSSSGAKAVPARPVSKSSAHPLPSRPRPGSTGRPSSAAKKSSPTKKA